jgi:septal ring factor EnvC (AmiA/AmiB activator)
MELKLCKTKNEEELDRCQEQIKGLQKDLVTTVKMKEDMERKLFKLNNDLVDAKSELEESKKLSKASKAKPHNRPTVRYHPSTSGSSIVADSINDAALGWCSFYL